jgi:hypothetical protein
MGLSAKGDSCTLSGCPANRNNSPRAALRLPWAGIRQAFGLKTSMIKISLEN